MKVSIFGDFLITENTKIKSRPIIRAFLEAFSGLRSCSDLDRSRARRTLRTDGPYGELGSLFRLEAIPFQWAEKAPYVTMDQKRLDKELALSILRGTESLEPNRTIGSKIFSDVEGWTVVFTLLKSLQSDPYSQDADKALNLLARTIVQCEYAKAVCGVLCWQLHRRLTGNTVALGKTEQDNLKKIGIGELELHVKKLSEYTEARRSAILDGEVLLVSEPDSVSLSLLSIKREIDAFYAMKKLRSGRVLKDKRASVAECVIHFFASSLLISSFDQRLGRAVSGAANMASSYLELHTKGHMPSTVAPALPTERILLAFKWLKLTFEIAMSSAKGERPLLLRCVFASCRRASLYAQENPVVASTISPVVESLAKAAFKNFKSELERVWRQPEALTTTTALKLIAYGDLVEAWKTALVMNVSEHELPSPFGNLSFAELATSGKREIKNNLTKKLVSLRQAYASSKGAVKQQFEALQLSAEKTSCPIATLYSSQSVDQRKAHKKN